jgi:hypothetical protein
MFEIIRRLRAFGNRARLAPGLVVLAVAAFPLTADTLLTSNFPYTTGTGDAWATGGSGESGNAVGFTDPSGTSSYSLTQIQVADNFSSQDPNGGAFNDLIVGLWVSSTDLNSATELESWIVTTNAMGTPELFTLTPGTSTTPTVTPTIAPGENYFITETVPEDGANTAEWGWQWNNLATQELGYFSEFAGGSWFAETGPTPAFTVSGNLIPPSTVPEPRSYAALLGAAFAGILILRRRRNSAA